MAKSKKKGKTKRAKPIPSPGGVSRDVCALAFHADYRCANSGVCCSADWQIPVEPEAQRQIRRHLRDDSLHPPGDFPPDADLLLTRTPNLPAGAEVALGRDDNGHCLFFDESGGCLCTIHRDIGHEAIPVTCQMFPRLCVLQPRGTFITLSHFCPTAAAMLFRDDADITIVHGPEAFPAGHLYAGHDARNHAPPLLRPDVLLSWETHDLWERHTVATMANESLSPEEALILLCISAEKARNWTEQAGDQMRFLKHIFKEDSRIDPEAFREQITQIPSGLHRAAPLSAAIVRSLPETGPHLLERQGNPLDVYLPDDAARLASDFDNHVRPRWAEFHTPIRRHLAARLFANQFAYQGDGLRTGLFAVVTSLAVLRVHAAALCARERRDLDRDLLLEAIRQTDFLLLHVAARPTLLKIFKSVEPLPLTELLAPIPL